MWVGGMAVISLVTISSSLESLSLTGLALTDAKDFKRLERLVSNGETYRKIKIDLLGPKLLKRFAYVVDIRINQRRIDSLQGFRRYLLKLRSSKRSRETDGNRSGT